MDGVELYHYLLTINIISLSSPDQRNRNRTLGQCFDWHPVCKGANISPPFTPPSIIAVKYLFVRLVASTCSGEQCVLTFFPSLLGSLFVSRINRQRWVLMQCGGKMEHRLLPASSCTGFVSALPSLPLPCSPSPRLLCPVSSLLPF